MFDLPISWCIAALLAAAPGINAQSFTNCNPLNSTCPDDPALSMSYNFDFSQASNLSTWRTTAGSVTQGTDGTRFTINKRFDSPTLRSNFYIFFGTVEIHMKASAGQGIISSLALYSDDLDEVDWEFIGSNRTHAETNYFGKGNATTYDRAIYHPMSDPTEAFHNYTVHWTSERIDWYIDTVLTRTLMYKDAVSGNNFPQTPMYVQMGIWAGGDPSLPQGTIDWAGGLADFSKGPYTMTVQSVRISDASNGKAYHYGDRSGSYQSIQIVPGNSTAHEMITRGPEPPEPSLAEKFAALPQTAKIGIYAGSAAIGAILLSLLTFCCIKQKRAGRRERDAYAAKLEAERLDNERWQIELKEKGCTGDELPFTSTPSEMNGKADGAGYFPLITAARDVPAVPPLPKLPSAYESRASLASPTAYAQSQTNDFAALNGPNNAYAGQHIDRSMSASRGYNTLNNNGYSSLPSRSMTASPGFQNGNLPPQRSMTASPGYQNNFRPPPRSMTASPTSYQRKDRAASSYDRGITASPGTYLSNNSTRPGVNDESVSPQNRGNIPNYSSRPGGSGYAQGRR